jgi:branched-chain amino acid transport system ATP-binding protein
VTLGGRDITRAAPEVISAAGISRTFQTSRVFPALTVFDSVMMGVQSELIGYHRPGGRGVLAEIASVTFRLPGYRRRLAALEARAEEVLQLFGERLWPRRDAPAYSLSYANRRRLEIARALVAEPAFLLLDEPTAGMNPTETRELTELIAELHQRRPHLSILLVEHKLDVVRRLAGRVVVMNQGKVIVEETPEEALSDPRVIEAYLGHRAAEAADRAAADG